LFWAVFEAAARHDAVETVEYLADQLNLSAIRKRHSELVEYDSVKLSISFAVKKQATIKASKTAFNATW
jgi:hypothetical protein